MGRIYDNTPPRVQIKRCREKGCRNDFARLEPIRRLAALAAEHHVIFNAVAGYAATTGAKLGYSQDIQSDMTKTLRVLAAKYATRSEYQLAITCCEGITHAFDASLAERGANRDELAGLFTAGITEAIVRKVLLKGERTPARLIPDAEVYNNGKRVAGRRNIDFFWSTAEEDEYQLAEAYECKNGPAKLVQDLGFQERRWLRREWKRSKLFLMLQLHNLLTRKGIRVHLGVVTLKPQAHVDRDIERTGLSPPEELHIYARDSVLNKLPYPAYT